MKSISLILIHLFTLTALAQEDIQILSARGENGEINISAENTANFEQSIKLDVNYKGMKPSRELPIIQVIPPRATVFLMTMVPEPNKSYSYKYQYTYIQGDVTGTHDDSYVYRLPYKKGREYMVGQSYNERPTHMNQYAVDFNMDVGTEITAVRGGVVTRVVEKFDKGCPKEECSQYNNFVLVKHEDGSVADYSHIKKNGALVKTGDQIKAGDPVALSGATGWASGPHLHFEIYVMRFSGQESIAAKYYLDSNTIGIPKSGIKYKQEL